MPDPVAEVKSEAPALRMSDDPVLVEKVQADLDKFADIETPDTPAVETPAVPESEKTPKEGDDAGGLAGDDDQPPVATETPETPETPDGAAAPAAPAADASTLPEAYRRSAKAREWTDAEIERFYKQDPELAIKTFEKMHQSRVSEVEQWAELGRRAKAAAQPAPAAGAAPAVPADPLAALKPVDPKAMAEKYGNAELMEEIAAPLNAAIKALQPLIENAKAAYQATQQTQQDVLAKTVNDFFNGPELKPYEEVYGTDWSKLSPKQEETRKRTLEVADSLIAGAKMQGRSIDTIEALTLAHESVSSQFKERVIRDTIRKSATQRAKGVTLKPSGRGAVDASGPPKNRADMEQRAADRLREVFTS